MCLRNIIISSSHSSDFSSSLCSTGNDYFSFLFGPVTFFFSCAACLSRHPFRRLFCGRPATRVLFFVPLTFLCSHPSCVMLKFCQGYNGQHRSSELCARVAHTLPKTQCEKRIMKAVRLEKDPKCGFGMVITCGNTYDTVLHGAFVESIHPGSPADRNGNIGPGDQIIFVNGIDVQNDHFLTVVDILQYSNNSAEIVIAKANKVADTSNYLQEEITEKSLTKSKVWVVGEEKNKNTLQPEKSESDKMPIPQPRKKWLDQEKPVNFNVPDLTLNHASKLISNQSWKKETNCDEIYGQKYRRESIPDIIASQIKYETEPISSLESEGTRLEKELYSQLSETADDNILLPGEIFHVVLDKKGGSLGLNIYQGTESNSSEQRHIYIHSIIPNGAADLDGRIKPGDKLLEVNEVVLENLSYQEVVTKLRESPQVAHLVLEKGNLIETNSDSKNESLKMCSETAAEEVISQKNSAAAKRSEYASQAKKELTEYLYNLNTSTETFKDCDTESNLNCSLPSAKLCNQSANGSVLHHSYDDKQSVQPNIYSTPYKESTNSFRNLTCPSSPLNAKMNGRKTCSKLGNKLTPYCSTPNLTENSDDEEIKNGNNFALYRNKSTECLTSPIFSNPHQAPFNIYRNFHCSKGSTNSLQQIPTVPIRRKKLKRIQDIYDYSNPDNTFTVTIRKSSRGLGLSIFGGIGVGGRDIFSQLIRIRKLYPLQPALECGKLQLGDVILSVNGTNMVGLTNTEALEVLRATPSDVVLDVFRPSKSLIPSYTTFKDGSLPFCESSSSSASSSLSRTENTYNVETGEFEVTLIKRGGSLGFSISKKDSLSENDDGIYVKALVREPAISDGRIHPGDKILQVNGVPISSMSHAAAIEFIRKTPDTVTLKLARDEPPPTPDYTEKENQITKPLRWEAMELLSDRMKNKESGDENSVAKRKIKRKLDRSSNAPSNSSTDSSSSSSSSSSGQEHVIEENLKCDTPDGLCIEGLGLQRNQRPKSLDVLNSSDRKRLPTYLDEESFHRQSSVMCPNVDSKTNNENGTRDNPLKKACKNLIKWRGSTLPHTVEDSSPDVVKQAHFSISSHSNEQSQASQDSTSDDEKPVPFPRTTSRAKDWVNTFDVDLDRGWHGRLGFSLYDPPASDTESPRSLLPKAAEVKAVHPSSLAEKDGRIKVGDRIVEVNRECLLGKPATEVIDILRKTTGIMRMVFCRLEKRV